MAWRRRWYGLAVAWVVCMAGWAVIPFLPNIYESKARVYVDTQTLLGPLLKGIAVESDTQSELDIMQRTLTSRPNMEKVARMTDLDLTVTEPPQMEGLIAALTSKVTIRSEARNLFTISFEDQDPAMARRVVQSLLTIYVESNLGTSRQEMDSARRFLDEQIRDYERQLDTAEQRLANFKQANIGLLPGNTGYYQRLEGARADLAMTRSRYEDAVAKLDELKRQLSDVPQFFASAAAGPLSRPPSDTQVRVLELERTIDELLIRYTEQHPDVVSAKRRLENLREQLQKEMESEFSGGPGTDAPGTGPSTPNPVYEQVKLQLVNAESNVAALRGSVARAEENVARIEQLANRVPAVEAELSKLNRDYGIVKKNYEALLARREAARISENREAKSDKAVFRIIDPPQVPVKPSGPPRALFLSVVLVVGLGVGVAFAVFLANINRTYFTVSRLKEAFGIHVLGSISRTVSPAERSWQMMRLATFVVVGLGLFGAYGGLFATESARGLHTVVPTNAAEKIRGKIDQIFSVLPE